MSSLADGATDVVAEGKKSPPSLSEDDGRQDNGRFGKGNRVSKGNPHSKRVNQIRSTFLNVVTPKQYRRAVLACLKKAIGGDVVAFKELNDRLLGKSKQPIEVSGGKRALRVKATFDLSRFLRELDDVQRERQVASGGMVPPNRN